MGVEEETEKPTVREQARRYFLQDVAYLIVITFGILIFERPKLDRQFMDSCKEDQVVQGFNAYGDFSMWKIIFEVVSPYGTVGLSLGYRDSPASFSGSWSR